MSAAKESSKLIAQNRKARHNYEIESSLEAGIALVGTEVKSCRAGKVDLGDAYALVEGGEAWLYQAHIAPYSHGNRANHDPGRKRKLLLKRGEIERLGAAVQRDGRTLVPLRMYLKRGLVKVEIAIGRGRKTYDKRHAIASRDADRRMRQEVGRRR